MTIQSVAEHILTLERRALDRWGAGDPGGYLDLYAADITYFDPATAKRIDGLPAMREYYAPWTGKIHIDRYEILNPSAVVTDNMALLTYNLVNFAVEDGAERLMNRWNATVVYQRHDGAWKIVHSHWSYTQPAFASAASPA